MNIVQGLRFKTECNLHVKNLNWGLIKVKLSLVETVYIRSVCVNRQFRFTSKHYTLVTLNIGTGAFSLTKS